jgi:hypothetical protein
MGCRVLKQGINIKTNILCALQGYDEDTKAINNFNTLITLDLIRWPK